MIRKIAPPCVLIIWLSLVLGGCTQAPATFGPLADHHEFPPPDLTWEVRNQDTGEVNQYNGTATLKAKQGERFQITLIAKEADGVYLVDINPTTGSGQMFWECVSQKGEESLREIGMLALESASNSLFPPHEFTAVARVNYELNLEMKCSDLDSIFVSGTAWLTGHASSSVLTEVTELLEFLVSP
jgi:hypothetical protein